MEPTKAKVKSKDAELSDEELRDKLKHLASQWFSNEEILLLEELFRRHIQMTEITSGYRLVYKSKKTRHHSD